MHCGRFEIKIILRLLMSYDGKTFAMPMLGFFLLSDGLVRRLRVIVSYRT